MVETRIIELAAAETSAISLRRLQLAGIVQGVLNDCTAKYGSAFAVVRPSVLVKHYEGIHLVEEFSVPALRVVCRDMDKKIWRLFLKELQRRVKSGMDYVDYGLPGTFFAHELREYAGTAREEFRRDIRAIARGTR